MTEAKTKKVKAKPKVSSLELLDLKGKVKGKVSLDEAVFNGKISLALLQQAVSIYLSNQRKGLASSKTRGEKKGGGRKPWRQKGTGRARVGSIRSPIWRGGGVALGPKPRSYYRKFPERMKASALRSAFAAKLKQDQVVLIDKLEVKEAKSKSFAEILSNLGIAGERVCLIAVSLDANLKKASANFKKVFLRRAADVNALGVLDCKRIVLTKDSLDIIQARLKKWI